MKRQTPHSARSRLPWKRSLPPTNGNAPFGIYSPRFFSQLLQYEKTRSERTNTTISLLAIELGAGAAQRYDAAAIAEALKARIRRTDAVGWLDMERIGVLLPGTSEQGAEAFAATVAAALPGLCGTMEVSTHPSFPRPRSVRRRSDDQVFPFGDDGCPDPVALGTSLERAVLPPIPLWKRTLDLVGATLAGLLLLPLILLVALYIKIVSPGPVLFSQARIGRGGREFRFIKFRSMHHNTDESLHAQHATDFIRSDGNMQKLDTRDPRIFFGGNVLRVSCMDELPQLWNVLRGDMSLVGPRPCIPYEAAEYQRWHRHRFDILPGMTGLWQVSGKNKLTFAEMIRLDISYQRTMSLWRDLLILLRTIPTVFGLVGEAVLRKLSRVRSRAAAPTRQEGSECID